MSPKIPRDIDNQEITSTGSDTTVYNRTTDRKFILEELMVHNTSGGPAVVEIWDGASTDGRKKLVIDVADTETVHFNSLYREFEFGDIVVQVDTQPVDISGSGHEE